MQEWRMLLLSRWHYNNACTKDNTSNESDAYAKGTHMRQL